MKDCKIDKINSTDTDIAFYWFYRPGLRPHNLISLISFVLLLSPKQSRCFTNFHLQIIEDIWLTEKFAFTIDMFQYAQFRAASQFQLCACMPCMFCQYFRNRTFDCIWMAIFVLSSILFDHFRKSNLIIWLITIRSSKGVETCNSHMFSLSDARDYSLSKVPYLEQEEKITDQSNFVNNVT